MYPSLVAVYAVPLTVQQVVGFDQSGAIGIFPFNEPKKGRDILTIEELKAALDRIPKAGAINKARRLQIQKQIFELMNKAGE